MTGSGAAGTGFGAEGAGTVTDFQGPEKMVLSKSYQNFKIFENFFKPKFFLESPCHEESKNALGDPKVTRDVWEGGVRKILTTYQITYKSLVITYKKNWLPITYIRQSLVGLVEWFPEFFVLIVFIYV